MSSANAVTAINNKVSPGDKTGLPWEIWQIILSWLSAKDLCHFAMVCKTWSELVISVDNTRWKELYLQCSEWRHPFWPLNVEAEPPSWRLAYRDQFTATRFWKKRQKYDSKHFSCASIFKRSIRPKNIHVGSGKEFDSLNGALSIVSPYDRIIMHPGIYDEQLEVRAKVPFELIGHGEMGSIILVAGIHQLGSTTRLSNLVLRAPWYTSFIIMISSGFLQLDNCIIENGMICAQNPSTLHVKFCTFRHSSIVLHNMNASIIENCEFSQSKSANIIIEGYPKENKNWTYSFLKERTNSIYHQNRSLHRKKHGLKATTSMSSTLHSSITTKSVTTMYSTQLHGPVGNDPIFDMDEPGASFLNPGLLVPMYLGSQKDVSVGCGDLQSMYQECGSSNPEQLSEKHKNSTKTVTDCSTSGASKSKPDNVSSNKNCAQSESASRRNSLFKRGVRRKSMDSHVGFRLETDDPALIQNKLANQQSGIELESCANSTTSCNKLRSKFQGRSKSFSAFSQSQRKCRSNQIEPVFLENSGIDSCHKNGSSIPISSAEGQNLFSTRRVCSETDLSNVSEKVHLINVKENYWKENHKHDCKCNSPGTSRGCQEISPVQDKVPLMCSGIRRSQSEEIIEISDDTDDDDQSSINELESAGESIDGADDLQDAISSSTDSSEVNSLDYMNSEDYSSSSEESVIMLPHLQEMYLGHPGLMSSGFSHTTDTDSINSECTRPVPVNISEDLLMSKYVGQIQGCLIHQCRMNHSKAGISVSLQAHVIISECDISNVNYGIRCIQHSKVVILKNKIHHCHTSGIFMRLSSSGLIAGNDIHSNSEAGIDIRKASDPLVQYNQIHHGKRSGIVVLGSGCGQIKKNDIYCNTEAGVYILFGANPIVSENYIYEGRAAGVAVNAAGRGCIIDNVIRGNKWGGVDIRNGSCPLVSGNSIINGVSDGIVVGSGGKGIIENNFISGNGGCGLWLLSAKNLYIHGNQICDSGHCGVMLIDMMSVGIEGLLEQNQFLPNLNHRTYSVNDVNPLFTEPTLPFTTLQYNNIYHNKGQGVMIQIDEDIRLLHNAIHGNQLEGIYMSQRAPVVVKNNSITNNGKSGIVTSEYDQISIIGNGVYNNHLHGVICRNECIIEENDIICHAASAIKVESNGNISVTKNRLGCSSGAAIKGVELSVIKATKNKIYFRGSGEFLVSSGQWSAADNYIVNQTKRQSKSDFSKTDFLSDPHPRPHIPPPPPLTVIPNQNIVQVKKVAPGRFCDQRTLAAADVEEQLISRLQDSKQFAIQLDESTDVSGQAQLMAYVRYIWMDEVEEDFLFCKACPGHTSAELFAILDNFMAANGIEWSLCIGVCTDGAAAMTGKRTGLWERVRSNVPTATFTHCMIHRESLASKIMNADLKSIFDQAIKIVNFIKAHPLNSRLFASLCSNMDFDHDQLLMHTEVRWLSRGKVFNRLFELGDVVREFLVSKNSQLVVHFNENSWVAVLAYLADIFEQLNKLNSSLQGKHTNLITLSDKVSAFTKKLALWKTRLFQGNFEMFDRLHEFTEKPENAEINKSELVKLISEHVQSLLDQFNFYFGDLNVESFSWVSSPFLAHIDSLHLPPSELNQFIALTSDTTLKMMHPRVSLMKFWTQASHEYPELSQKAFKIILPFATSYLCECGFSALVTIKTKYRSRLEVEDELRLSLSSITPRLDKLCSNLQAQSSH